MRMYLCLKLVFPFLITASTPLDFKFETCEGFANQRIAIIHGVLIGHLMGRTILLPTLSSSYNSSISRTLPFDYMYDVHYFRKSLKALGISTSEPIDFNILPYSFTDSYYYFITHYTRSSYSSSSWWACRRPIRTVGFTWKR